jgi:hypothetical protein
LALAMGNCAFCHGHGQVEVHRKRTYAPGSAIPIESFRLRMCGCVYRRVFRICWRRYQQLRERYGDLARRPRVRNGPGGLSFELRTVDFLADFDLLVADHMADREREIFALHFSGGADWKECCRRLGMDRGSFFHDLYRIERRIGRALLADGLAPWNYFAAWWIEDVSMRTGSERKRYMPAKEFRGWRFEEVPIQAGAA